MGVMYDKILGKLREDEGGSTPGGNSFRVEIVDTTQYATLGDFLKRATGENGVVYLYPNSNPYGENTYTELLWVDDDSKFEIIDRDITIDSKPTSASPNPVSSGGVYTGLEGKANKSEMSITPGTGVNADKTTIQLKNDTTATVLTRHQDISGKSDKIPVVDLSSQESLGYEFQPNIFYMCKTFSSGRIIFSIHNATDNTIANVWRWCFRTGETVPSVRWNFSCLWADGSAPTIEPNKYYEVRLMNGLVTVVSANL